MLLCAPRIAQVTDQFAGRATDIDPFYIVELLPVSSKISEPRTTATWMPLLLKMLPLTNDLLSRPRGTMRSSGGNSQINRITCAAADLTALSGIPQDP
jgi:hypothetical protein